MMYYVYIISYLLLLSALLLLVLMLTCETLLAPAAEILLVRTTLYK